MGRLQGAGRNPRGFNVIEMAIVVSIFLIVAGIAIPGIVGGVQRTGVDGASRRIAEDIRLAQSNAITRGLQARLLIFDQNGVAQVAGGTNITDTTKANLYRIETRTSATASWPALADTPGSNTNVVTAWNNLRSGYGGVNVTTSNVLVFRTLGNLDATSALDIVLQGSGGTKTVRTSVIGKATIL
ncbi:MAG: Tfp pilus assembly protein FimT/FimU [Candidatus Methylomirabilales bacterium]